MKKNLIIVWKVVAVLCGLPIFWAISALFNDKLEHNIIEDWTILGSGVSMLLFSLTFMVLLEEKNNAIPSEDETLKPEEPSDATDVNDPKVMEALLNKLDKKE